MRDRGGIQPDKLYWSLANSFEMRIIGQAVLDICHSGPCDNDVAYWQEIIAKQVEADNFPNQPTPEKIREELREYGAWSDEELADDRENWLRIVWIMAGNIGNDEERDCSEPLTK